MFSIRQQHHHHRGRIIDRITDLVRRALLALILSLSIFPGQLPTADLMCVWQ